MKTNSKKQKKLCSVFTKTEKTIYDTNTFRYL